MLKIIPIPIYNDNYVWILHNNHHAVVVDPGLSEPVNEYLSLHQLVLSHILITHHHWDHVNGLEALQTKWDCDVYAPDDSRIPGQLTTIKEQDEVLLSELGLTLKVIETPGHTLSHICYFNDQYLFCGDTLFSLGCGRMFEGTATQFVNSLNKLKSLSRKSLIFCTHEYTLSNINFALSIEPDNNELVIKRDKVIALRKNNTPSLPVPLFSELMINPFLRTHQKEFQEHLAQHLNEKINDEVTCFAKLRASKDNFN